MAKRKRHVESGERVGGADHKRAKVEVPAAIPDEGLVDPAGSDQPSKKGRNEQKGPVQASRKHDNARRALKHEGKDKEQSRETVNVSVQNEKAKRDGKDRAGGKEHEAPSPGTRKHNKKLKALKKAEEKEQSGPKFEVPGRNEDGNSNVHEHTEGNNQSIPLQGSRKHKKKPRALRRAANKEQSGQKAEVTLQNDESDKRDGHEQAEGKEHKAFLPGSQKHNNPERARKRAEEKEQSGANVEVPAQNKKDDNKKSDGLEQVEGHEDKASLPGQRKDKYERRALKYQAKEEGQSGEKAKVPTQRKARMEQAHRGEASREPHPGEVALIDGELPGVPASQKVKAKLKKSHGSYWKAQRLAQRAMAAAGDTIKKIDSSDQNEAQETQPTPVIGKKHKRDKAQKQDGKAITISEPGKESAGKDVSEVMERLGGHEVQQPSRKKTKSKSSRKKNLKSNDVEAVGLEGNKVMEPSDGHEVQRHSSKKTKSTSGKKSTPKSTGEGEAERSMASESVLEQAVAASYPEWNVARSTGGQMLDTDPIFSKDEE